MRVFGVNIRLSLPLVCILLASRVIFAQNEPAADRSEIRKKLTTPPPDCSIVAENAARLINRTPDKTSFIVAEWDAMCRESPAYEFFQLSARLNTITAESPEINDRLWRAMRSDAAKSAGMPRRSEWETLLSRNANDAEPVSADGRLIKTWLLSGHQAFRSELRREKSGKLANLANEERQHAEEGVGISLALTAGAWLPTGNLARLGNHPTIGYYFAGSSGRLQIGLTLDFRFAGTTSQYRFFNPNTGMVENTNTFFGFYIGPDVAWEFLKLDSLAFFATLGLGYDLVSHYAAPRYSGKQAVYSDSLSLNGGLAIRWYFTEDKNGYLSLIFRHHRVDLHGTGTGGDDLAGSYFTVGGAAGYRILFD